MLPSFQVSASHRKGCSEGPPANTPMTRSQPRPSPRTCAETQHCRHGPGWLPRPLQTPARSTWDFNSPHPEEGRIRDGISGRGHPLTPHTHLAGAGGLCPRERYGGAGVSGGSLPPSPPHAPTGLAVSWAALALGGLGEDSSGTGLCPGACQWSQRRSRRHPKLNPFSEPPPLPHSHPCHSRDAF